MKKLSAVVLSLMLCVSMSFAARGGSNSSSSSQKKSSSSSSSSSGNFGIGYSKVTIDTIVTGANNLSASFDEIAGRYWFDDKIAIDAQLGFGSGDATSRFLIGGKVIGNVVSLNNLNVYLFGGLSFGSVTIKNVGMGGADQDASLFLISGGVGAEYYVLPCLSVLTEMGIRYWSIKPDGGNSMNDFGLYADWLPQAGVRYYF